MSDKVYFVDSENVGARWIDLMEEDQESDFLVFYTGNSPHLDYEHTIRLLNIPKKPEFIRCNEGKNALDFQLVSYLGYVLGSDEVKEAVILSNDAGFDPLICFWRERNKTIKRHCVKLTSSVNIKEGKSKGTVESVQTNIAELNPLSLGVDLNDIYTIINCFGLTDTKYIHNAFLHFFGNEQGKMIYHYEKSRNFTAPHVSWNLETKIKKFCDLIIKYKSHPNVPIPKDFVSFLIPLVDIGVDPDVFRKKAIEKYGDNRATQVLVIFMPFYRSLIQIHDN